MFPYRLSLLYYGKSRVGTYGAMVYSKVRAWGISLFLFGFIVLGINNWPHGGEIISGILLGMLLDTVIIGRNLCFTVF